MSGAAMRFGSQFRQRFGFREVAKVPRKLQRCQAPKLPRLTGLGCLRKISGMSRPSGFAPGGMVFHVLNRGAGRRPLFDKDEDYAALERVLEETLHAGPMRICAYCLMPNLWHSCSGPSTMAICPP